MPRPKYKVHSRLECNGRVIGVASCDTKHVTCLHCLKDTYLSHPDFDTRKSAHLRMMEIWYAEKKPWFMKVLARIRKKQEALDAV
jgi:hypothetical protein